MRKTVAGLAILVLIGLGTFQSQALPVSVASPVKSDSETRLIAPAYYYRPYYRHYYYRPYYRHYYYRPYYRHYYRPYYYRPYYYRPYYRRYWW